MPYDLRIISGKDFIRLDAEGHFDFNASRRLFSDAVWACVNARIGCVLLDVREAVSDMTASQLCGLANVCQEISSTGCEHKIAILARPEVQFDRVTALAVATHGSGWNVAAFHDFEQAFEWLCT